MRGHLIGGEERPGAGSGAVEAGGSSWSRANSIDLERALGELSPVEPDSALRSLALAGDCLAESAGEWLGLRLGLSAGEGVVLAAEAAAQRSPVPLSDGEAGRGPRVLRAGWRGLLGDLAAALGEAFAAGRPALILADPLLPELAHSFGEVLLECGLPAHAVAVLHACGDDLDAPLEAVGLEPRPIVALRGGVLRVGPEDDPEAAASHAIQAAFSRVPSLVGQRGFGPRLVSCEPRLLSVFTESLLLELEELGRATRLAAIEPRSKRALERAVERALDIGATPIWGCEGTFGPCVMTNLEPGTLPPAPGLPLLLLSRSCPDE
ncbi:hypothetical protein [Engelhardtia mirabilis]|uniref:hypothetical protein n=1 Tax=Engelhardtia mirabilis TaxID=2528011 RepID=UPI0011A98C34